MTELAPPTTEPILAEAGTTGLKHYGGYVREEQNPKLDGIRGVKVYGQMADTSPVLGGALLAIMTLLRSVDFDADPANESPEAHAESAFLQSCMDDMETTWDDFISEVLTCLIYGWSLFEEVYKLRKGENEKFPQLHSSHEDGRIGWRNLAPRPQDTLLRWVIDENGRTLGMVQSAEPDFKLRTIDFRKALLFRPSSRKNNPEGRSMLRNAHDPWFRCTNIQNVEGIGIERDLAGYPVMQVPPELLHPKANADNKATLRTYQTMIERIRRDQYEGSVIPCELDREGKPTGYKLSLLSSGGRRPIDSNEIVKRLESRMLISLLSEFVLLGQDGEGSNAMHSDKTTFFGNAMGAVLKSIVSVLNRSAVPRLFRLNGVDRSLWPKVRAGDLEKQNVEKTVNALVAMAGGGVISLDDEIDDFGRDLIEAPKKKRLPDAETVAPTHAPPVQIAEQALGLG